MKEPVRVLFVNSEIFPYLPESDISIVGRYLPQGIQESGKEIRSFMPKYGCINERRNQLHEVIRLSGMNIIISDIDRPLVIKVSSIPSARMQVYFIDNEDYFHRKQIIKDLNDQYMADNDERALFFARGVLETVKKLRWKPDIIHCQGWISHFLPFYLKKSYNDDPVFSDSKVVLSIYNESLDQQLSSDIITKALVQGTKAKQLEMLSTANGINLAKLAIQYSDGIISGVEKIDSQLMEYIDKLALPVLPYIPINYPESAFIEGYNNFYDQILDK